MLRMKARDRFHLHTFMPEVQLQDMDFVASL